MRYRAFTEAGAVRRRWPRLALLAGMVAMAALAAGCASTGGGKTVADEGPADPEGAVAPGVRADYGKAVALLEAGDLEGAEALLSRFVDANPAYPGAWTNLAIVYRRDDRPDEAKAALDRALGLDEGYAPALNQLGVMHREAGRFNEAEAAYLKAVTADPEYPLAHFNLGVLNDLYLGSPETALTHYEQYQALTSGGDDRVAMWIVDIRRRLGIETQSARAD
ncbi:tetratricopeptide repeat protein [Lentisalinibacter orientalis]|uniref:tetratricopeptide repeat protein n=1 Tax=Lentisalinibacter orientalis TaxID=2992241 RepID=UPI0038696306